MGKFLTFADYNNDMKSKEGFVAFTENTKNSSNQTIGDLNCFMTGNELNYAFQQTVNSNYNFGSGDKLIDSFPTWPSMKTKKWFNPYAQFKFFYTKNGTTPNVGDDYPNISTTAFSFYLTSNETQKDAYCGLYINQSDTFFNTGGFYHKDHKGTTFTYNNVGASYKINYIAGDGTIYKDVGNTLYLMSLGNIFHSTDYIKGIIHMVNAREYNSVTISLDILSIYLFHNGIRIDLSNSSTELYTLN